MQVECEQHGSRSHVIAREHPGFPIGDQRIGDPAGEVDAPGGFQWRRERVRRLQAVVGRVDLVADHLIRGGGGGVRGRPGLGRARRRRDGLHRQRCSAGALRGRPGLRRAWCGWCRAGHHRVGPHRVLAEREHEALPRGESSDRSVRVVLFGCGKGAPDVLAPRRLAGARIDGEHVALDAGDVDIAVVNDGRRDQTVRRRKVPGNESGIEVDGLEAAPAVHPG